MFDRITFISSNSANVLIREGQEVTSNIMNMHVIFEDASKKILGEVEDINGDQVRINFLGEIYNNKFIGGVLRKPNLDSTIRLISPEEMKLIVGTDIKSSMELGKSPLYEDTPINVDINELFSNHMAIFGNSGSGKSCGVSRIIQNVFSSPNFIPFRSNFFIFDSSGEYRNAFHNLNSVNVNYNYKFYTTNKLEGDDKAYPFKLPIWLCNVDDLALLLGVTTHSQIPIIERMFKLVRIFGDEGVDSEAYKNHLIASAIRSIIFTNQTASSKRNDIFQIVGDCPTKDFNMNAQLQGVGYTRKFTDCFQINNEGEFSESVLIRDYIYSFIRPELDNYEPKPMCFYTLNDLEKALNFTLISEGWLRNETTYGDAVTLKVKLHSLVSGNYAKFFDCPTYMDQQQFIAGLLMMEDGKHKAQIINFNLEDVDDSFAKALTKIYSRILFEFCKTLTERGSIPFNLLLEEAHRYIQNDTDTYVLGYNIFDRIAKEGRKYGIILSLISQRPVDISDTVIAQCANFLIFKMNHPRDLDYIEKMIPNISKEIIEKLKTLQSGTCMSFGSAFKIPMIVKLDMPNPSPKSANVDVFSRWTN